MRQMVMARKGAVAPADDETDDAPDAGDAKGEGDEATEQPAKCPNCGCQFDDETGDVVKEGAKVVGGPKDSKDYANSNQGPDLDTADSAEPVPGKFGTARDAAGGSEALAQLLGPLLAAGGR